MKPEQEVFEALLECTSRFVMQGMHEHASAEHMEACGVMLRAGARSRVVMEFNPPRFVYVLVDAEGVEHSVFTFAAPPEFKAPKLLQ